MDVVDGLPTLLVAVHHHAEAIIAAKFFGQALGGEQDMTGKALVVLGQVIEGTDVFFFGMTRKCTGAWGAISWNARTWSSS